MSDDRDRMRGEVDAAARVFEVEGELRWLRSRVRELEVTLNVTRQVSEGRKALIRQAGQVARVTQAEGGRHALLSAVEDYDDSLPWPEFLTRRAEVLEAKARDLAKGLNGG